MRVLLIGGTVFIGRAIAQELVDNGHEVCFVHRGKHEPDDLPSGEHIHVDRAELGSVRSRIDAFDPDAVIDNMALTRRDAQTALEALPEDRRLVVTSSMDVYRAYTYIMKGGSGEPVPIDESSAVRDERYPYRGQGNPMFDDYEKLDVEEIYLAAGATALRLPMVYGPHDGQRREELILRRVRANRDRIPVGAGTWRAAKGFVGDVARGTRLAVESEAARGEILNLGESHTYPMSEWAQMILDAAGNDAELVRVPDEKLPPDLGMLGTIEQDLLVDSTKAREMLGWTDTDPRETLKVSVAWHLAHPPDTDDPGFDADDEALA
ncbi:MAG TPA: NAD-dependent epimerase/dehydratase family protein [Actinomycetota bacterium]|jgi:nucleoside-diphosphate-sugar epimerase|nr:NAD-dependent epimerase/dehydratase family protein [Actinomycetota bacterium]